MWAPRSASAGVAPREWAARFVSSCHAPSMEQVHWLEEDKPFQALWRSLSGTPTPTRVVVADGKLTADEAYGLACQGTALLWRGDFQEARQMLTALGNRADRRQRKSRTSGPRRPLGE